MIDDMDFGLIVMANADGLATLLLAFNVLGKALKDEAFDFYEKARTYQNSLINQKKEKWASLEKSRENTSKPHWLT